VPGDYPGDLPFEPRSRWVFFNSLLEENLLDIALAGGLCNTSDETDVQEEF
jgi:hypothetical protein